MQSAPPAVNRGPFFRTVLRGALFLLLPLLYCAMLPAQLLKPVASTPPASADQPAALPPCPTSKQEASVPEAPAPAGSSTAPQPCQPASTKPLAPLIDWYSRFINGPEVKPMTPTEKARLAARNLLDPFNALTILGTSGISVAANSHSPYGPGMKGFGKDVGTSYSQDLTSEFFGTFLIPSLVHQDPHYHRRPNASIPSRIEHSLIQVVWTRGDNGHHMLNYANLAGFAIDDAIGNTYLPGRNTSLGASAKPYGIDLALAPEDNLITEFLPDLARHIHVRSVLVRRIVDRVARTDANSQ
ncbi:MAG: hypothetical protein P4K83_09595 [Terracidiphilus sp.]|nr:hypothetical protein [Terracidiphilus sp.]